jgi:hypothetical protein
MMPGAGGDVNTTLPLVLSIVATVFCCGLGTILGIIGIVFSIQAKNAKAKTATILAIVAYVLGILGGVVSAIANSH